MKKIGGINFGRKLQNFQKRKAEAMRAIANNSVNFFKVTIFEAQGFIYSGSVERWSPRKAMDKRDKRTGGGRKLLVDTGHGRQSIHTVSITATTITIRAEAEYMRFHNEGTKKLPKRKFMGESKKLDQENISIFKRKMKGLL